MTRPRKTKLRAPLCETLQLLLFMRMLPLDGMAMPKAPRACGNAPFASVGRGMSVPPWCTGRTAARGLCSVAPSGLPARRSWCADVVEKTLMRSKTNVGQSRGLPHLQRTARFAQRSSGR